MLGDSFDVSPNIGSLDVEAAINGINGASTFSEGSTKEHVFTSSGTSVKCFDTCLVTIVLDGYTHMSFLAEESGTSLHLNPSPTNKVRPL